MVLTEKSVVRVMTPISVSSRNITKCSHFSNAGFTLLEIILVLAIIGLASVLIFPTLVISNQELSIHKYVKRPLFELC